MSKEVQPKKVPEKKTPTKNTSKKVPEKKAPTKSTVKKVPEKKIEPTKKGVAKNSSIKKVKPIKNDFSAYLEKLKSPRNLMLLGVVIVALIIILLIPKFGKSYTVSFDTKGANVIKKIMIKENAKLKLPKEPQKEGFKFNGWLINGNRFDENTKITQNITLTADWLDKSKNIFKVTFKYDNGMEDTVIEVEEDTLLNKPETPVKKGYSFNNWFFENNPYDFNSKVTKELILLAKWDKLDSSVSCPSGYVVFQNTCRKLVSSLNASKTCSNGYSLNGDKCVKTETSTTIYTCNSGKVELNGKCYTQTEEQPRVSSTPCRTGFYHNNYGGGDGVCQEQVASIVVPNSASCDAGYYFQPRDTFGWCYKIYYYACTAPGVRIVKDPVHGGNVCIYSDVSLGKGQNCPQKNSYVYSTSNSRSCVYFKQEPVNKECPTSGNLLVNGKCYGNVSNKVASCQQGYSLSGNSCIKTTIINPTYSCQLGYTRSGTKCL